MVTKKDSLLVIYFSLLTHVFVAARLIHRFNSSNSDPFQHNSELMGYSRLRDQAETLGEAKLKEPVDILYVKQSRVIYTGCNDGWIKRLKLNNSTNEVEVEEWVNTGGRPLGLSRVPGTNDIIVADAYKGLIKIEEDGKMKVLTDKANGKGFKLTDGVEVGKNGKVYFTDASSKYNLQQFLQDILGVQPNGRLLSYDLRTSTTQVLASGLYFPNGVALSPSQDFLVFCETSKKRCRKYNIKGERKGEVEDFVELPELPDKIHYKDGNFWIAAAALPEKMGDMRWKTGRVYAVDLGGEVSEIYNDTLLECVSSALKIGHYVYCGSNVNSFILRLPLL